MGGPRPIVDPPVFTPAPYGLLNVLQPVSPVDAHWQNGVTWQSRCMDTMGATTYDECLVITGSGAVPEPSTKTGNVSLDTRGATPFTVYTRFDCGPVGFTPAEAAAAASDALARTEGWQVERAVWTGLADGKPVVFPHLAANADKTDPINITLQQAASVVVTGGAVDIATGLGLLEASLADCYNGVGLIHVPIKAIPTLDAHGLLRDRNGSLRTLNGNIVVAGAGYPGTSPAGAAPATGESWLYATGPMFMYRSQPRYTELRDSLDRSTNTVQWLAERTYVLGWDCCHVAVLVDIGVSVT